MWKYAAFMLLIVFTVPAVLGQNITDSAESSVKSQPDTPTEAPTASPTEAPTASPTEAPTASPTEAPTASPTEAPTTSPTEAPTTSPTEAPTTTPTAEPTTTSSSTTVPPPPSTPLPPPDVGKYSIHEKGDENKTCMRVEMALRVSINDLQASYNFPGNASTVGSDCNVTNTQVLKLSANDLEQTLTLIFVQEDKKTYVQDIIFTYSAPEVKTANTSGHFFSAAEGNSYLCHSDVTVKMENVTLTFSSIHIQAYGANSFGRAEECDADDKVGDIVPIAVGCALGALVIIVLIAYLVGRRRSHQKGYQSV